MLKGNTEKGSEERGFRMGCGNRGEKGEGATKVTCLWRSSGLTVGRRLGVEEEVVGGSDGDLGRVENDQLWRDRRNSSIDLPCSPEDAMKLHQPNVSSTFPQPHSKNAPCRIFLLKSIASTSTTGFPFPLAPLPAPGFVP